MSDFRNFWFNVLTLFCGVAVYNIAVIILSAITRYTNPEGTRYERSLTEEIFLFKVTSAPLLIDIYFFVCINSLYYEIKILNVAYYNSFVIQQQRQVMIDNLCSQQTQRYNPAIQPGYTQVAIPMVPLNPEESKIQKPQAV